jgi:DNA-binding GntR family transcriptional regulator
MDSNTLTHEYSAEEIVALIEEDIVFGRLYPKERLLEEVLTERFNTSRYVIRAAFALLEKLGLISKIKNRGVVVKSYTPEEVEQLYFMRDLLETTAAQIMPLPMDCATLNELIKIHSDYEAKVAEGDIRRTFRIDINFHEVLFAACGNPFLSIHRNSLANSAHIVRSYSVVDPVYLDRSRDEHKAMIDAITAGDRRKLSDLCRIHLLPSKNAYIRAYLKRYPR